MPDEVDPTLGGPCNDDSQCSDSVDCTVEHCDLELRRCRFTPDDNLCPDTSYCDGAQKCDQHAGCVNGAVVNCSDDISCTIDSCVEATRSCRHDPRDADSDGDPTHNCGGHDCDDADPLVNGQASEICGNGKDDNCDGAIDEDGCAAPEHDTCDTALTVTASGYYDLDLTATALDYPTSCMAEEDGYRDVVLQIVVPDGEPSDVDVIVKRDDGKVTLGTATRCGHARSTSCEPSFSGPLGNSVARLLLRGATTGTYPVYVAADGEGPVQVHVDIRKAEPQSGELCEDALPLEASGPPVVVRLPGYTPDVQSICQPLSGDAFVTFTLEEARDVTLIAEAQLDLGVPVLALLNDGCDRELTCRSTQPGRLFVRDLAPGTYRVLVGGTGPDDVSVRLETEAVSETPPGEGCDNAISLGDPGVQQVVDLSNHEDAVYPKCLAGAPDATFEFELAGPRDVALVGLFSDGDSGALSLASPTCRGNTACETAFDVRDNRIFLLRTVRYGLGAGGYRAVVESANGNPVGISWFERPAGANVRVPFADDCAGLVEISELGGRYSGNTSNSFPDFAAGCDTGGQAEGGAPDQILELKLTSPRRVILDMQGSAYQTMLSVREGEFCPGIERPSSCAPGYGPTRSFLDLDLQAGQYFVQIDGYDGASGPWQLDVFTAPL